MFRVMLVLAAVSAVAAADFFDDFEGYQPGENIETSPGWDREPLGGHAQVTDMGGDQAAEAVFTDSTFIGYICTGAGFWADGEVSMDMSPQGVGSFSNVYARLDIMNGGSYAAGLTFFFGSFTYAYIAYINAAGEYDLLYSDVGPVVSPGSWVNMKLHLEGSDPVALTLFIDDEQITKVYDYTYLLEEGISGFALFYEDQEPTILMDNFSVVEALTLQGETFGSIKAMFQ